MKQQLILVRHLAHQGLGWHFQHDFATAYKSKHDKKWYCDRGWRGCDNFSYVKIYFKKGTNERRALRKPSVLTERNWHLRLLWILYRTLSTPEDKQVTLSVFALHDSTEEKIWYFPSFFLTSMGEDGTPIWQARTREWSFCLKSDQLLTYMRINDNQLINSLVY